MVVVSKTSSRCARTFKGIPSVDFFDTKRDNDTQYILLFSTRMKIYSGFYINFWVLLNRAPSSTHLHSPPPSSTQLHPSPPSSFQPPPSSIHLHPTHFSLHTALCNTLNVIRTKISHVIGQFPQI